MKKIKLLLLCITVIIGNLAISQTLSEKQIKKLKKKFKQETSEQYNGTIYQHKKASSVINNHTAWAEIRGTELFIIVRTGGRVAGFSPKTLTITIDGITYKADSVINVIEVRYKEAISEIATFKVNVDLFNAIANYKLRKSIPIKISNNMEVRDGLIFTQNIIAWKETKDLYEALFHKLN